MSRLLFEVKLPMNLPGLLLFQEGFVSRSVKRIKNIEKAEKYPRKQKKQPWKAEKEDQKYRKS